MRKINRLQQEELECDICGYIIDGLSRSEIIDKITSQYSKYTSQNVIWMYDKCKKTIEQKISVDLESVVNLHVKWYEKLWRKFDSLNYVPGKTAALRQKEKILGLLKEDNIVKVENSFNINTQDTQYDITKLNKDEQNRLNGYLKRVQ